MTTDIQPALLGAVFVGFLGLLAGVIRSAMYNRSEHNVRRHESRSQLLQAQLSELYSPLLGHLYEIQSYYDVLQNKLAQLDAAAAAGEDAELSPDRREALCRRFAELYFDHLYRDVALLLRGRRHLISAETFPGYLQELLRFAIDIEASRAVASQLGDEYHPCSDDYVDPVRAAVPQLEAALADIKAEYERHLRSLGRLRWGRL
jgi:hypothetical protein